MSGEHHVLGLAISVLFTANLDASSSSPEQRRAAELVSSKASELFKLAWPVASYKSVEVESTKGLASGSQVVVILRGSAIGTDNLWVRATVTVEKYITVNVKKDLIVDVKWGKNNARVFRPTSNPNTMRSVLKMINWGSGPTADPNSPDAVAWREEQAKWKDFDSTMRLEIQAFSNQAVRLKREGKRRFSMIVSATPGCRAAVAFRYKGLDGQWVTWGWTIVDSLDSKIWVDLFPIDSGIWIHTRAVRGDLLDFRSREPVNMKIPAGARAFIHTGEGNVVAPETETVEFTKKWRPRHPHKLEIQCSKPLKLF